MDACNQLPLTWKFGATEVRTTDKPLDADVFFEAAGSPVAVEAVKAAASLRLGGELVNGFLQGHDAVVVDLTGLARRIDYNGVRPSRFGLTMDDRDRRIRECRSLARHRAVIRSQKVRMAFNATRNRTGIQVLLHL